SGTPRAGTGKARSGCEASWRVRLRVRAAGGAALQKLFGASNPARHAEGAELLARDVEELVRPVAIPVQLAADLHPGLLEVDERAQRARALLVEDGAGALEPVACLARASRQCAELSHCKARVDAWLAEIAGERLGDQVALQHVGEVGSAEAPERFGAVADQSSV